MSEEGNTSSSTESRRKLVEDLKKQFPEHAHEVEDIVQEIEIQTAVWLGEGFKAGYLKGFDQARKANKFTLANRTVFTIFTCPIWVMVAGRLVGENLVGLFVAGLIAAFTFWIADEALESLIGLFKKGKKDED